ncbi:glycosyltransferase family 31 protein [Atractiella rhizophila]|nr:glycosyltransferase family 31 protein [Atractiella rhizophila]
MTMEEEVEALIEGGSRFKDWTYNHTLDLYLPYNDLIYGANDPRLPHPSPIVDSTSKDKGFQPPDPASYSKDMDRDRNSGSTNAGTGGIGTAGRFLGTTKIGKEFARDPVEFTEKFWESEQGKKLAAKQREELVANSNIPLKASNSEQEESRIQKRAVPLTVEEKAMALVPPPTTNFDREYAAIRRQRFLGREHGGTVVVHYLKRNEWFLETALALLGRSTTWDHGSVSRGVGRGVGDLAVEEEVISFGGIKEGVELVEGAPWGSGRRYGSPIVREDGYVSEGREEAIVLPDLSGGANKDGTRSPNSRLKGTPRISFTDWNGNQKPFSLGDVEVGEEEEDASVEEELAAEETNMESSTFVVEGISPSSSSTEAQASVVDATSTGSSSDLSSSSTSSSSSSTFSSSTQSESSLSSSSTSPSLTSSSTSSSANTSSHTETSSLSSDSSDSSHSSTTTTTSSSTR